VIPAIRRLTQEGCEFEAMVGYTARPYQKKMNSKKRKGRKGLGPLDEGFNSLLWGKEVGFAGTYSVQYTICTFVMMTMSTLSIQTMNTIFK
jgi:magnesium-transporting ATPase (P-type)